MKSYSVKARQTLVNIFSKHNVKLEFENPKDFHNCINESISTSTKIHIAELRKNLCGAEMKEYDVFDRKYLSNIKGYTYAWIPILGDERVSKHFKIMEEAYPFFKNGMFDLKIPWAVSYVGNTNAIEGYYYSITRNTLPCATEEEVEMVYDSMSLSDKSREFLRNLRAQNHNTFYYNYIAFDMQKPRKIGLMSTIESFLNSNVRELYGEYFKLLDIVKCLEDSEDHTTDIGYQFIPNSDYFGIDVNLENSFVPHATQEMVDRGIIGEQDAAYILALFNQGVDDGLANITWKFRWTKKNKFTIKHYNYYNNPNPPAFI